MSLGKSEKDYRSPYVLNCGERLIAYSFFRKMITSGCLGNMRKVCPYFFLYWVIKTHFRQEMVLANDLVGLKNFQSISSRKTGMGGLADLCDRYAVTLKWNEGKRMGHCLSLFTDVENYYNGRHYNMLLTKQTLLDNLIWLQIKKKRLGRSFEISAEDAVNNKIQELFREIYDRNAPDDLDSFYGDAWNLNGERYDSR